MAKKKNSARSKGYRKTEQKKPFLTKKEIIWLVAIVAAIALVVILFNVFYDDGSLDIKDGAPVVENLDSSILVNTGNTDEPKYYKLAEIGEIEGYRREVVENTSDASLRSYSFYPEDETSKLDYMTIAGEVGTRESLIANSALGAMMSGITTSAMQTTEIDGREVLYFTASLDSTNEETGVTTCLQSLSAFTESAFEEQSVSISESVIVESEPNLDEAALAEFIQNAYLTDEELLANLEAAVTAISTDAKK